MLGIMLSGCDSVNQLQGPLAIRAPGGVVEVAICATLTVSSVYAEARNADGLVGFWDARGEWAVSSGDTVSTDTLADRFPRVIAGDNLPTGASTVAVVVKSADQRAHGNVVAAFPLDNEMGQSTWLHPDGSRTTRPCTDE
ncbi:MAG: hypothetical protein DI534_08125 [Leifsonia xyli]|nr:MAG: hypothetical protein DI534_08125 [Leifsonia xyli]